MAITYPRTDLFTGRGFNQLIFNTLSRQELSRTAGGVTLGKDLGPALWVAEWISVPEDQVDVVELEAKLRSLDGVIGAFTAYDRRRPYPKAYPSGAFTDSGKIAGVQSPKALTLKGLPAGFVISVGDYFMFDYGSSPSNRALHQASEAVTADGAGNTPSFEVRPQLRGAVVDLDVKFKLASAVFHLQEPFAPQVQQIVLGQVSIKAMQVIL